MLAGMILEQAMLDVIAEEQDEFEGAFAEAKAV